MDSDRQPTLVFIAHCHSASKFTNKNDKLLQNIHTVLTKIYYSLNKKDDFGRETIE